MEIIHQILRKSEFSKEDIVNLLKAEGDAKKLLYKASSEEKKLQVGNKVFFRGLIEMSNFCEKECYYCGIRKGNSNVHRYKLTNKEIIDAAEFAYKNNYGSIVIQSGELESELFAEQIESLLYEIKTLSNGELGITLSLGEQSAEVYRRWFNAGAHRYLIRIETSDTSLYGKIHPVDSKHNFEKRVDCIKTLQEIGYQTGTGVMIGLPFQTIENLAEDLLFFKRTDIDMVGMGPYIEHAETPLYKYKDKLLPIEERFDLSLKMIAVLRLLMKDVNIAAATALQAIDPLGREKAVKVGANIIMPNITPGNYRNDYALYENKPCVDEEPEQCKGCLDARISLAEGEIGYGEWGDSKHFYNRRK
jgi:biotin synthase